MFGRSSKDQGPTSPAPLGTPGPDDAVREGKGRPTPRRKVAESANRRPLVPTDRKGAAKAARLEQRAARDRQYQALQTGDERFLPEKDKGPVRRYIRDHVDARWNLGEMFLPVALVMLVLQIVLAQVNPNAAFVVLLALYAFSLVMLLDAYLMWRGLKKRLRAKFGEHVVVRGTAMYAVLRVFQIRPSRLPKPQVKHGQYPS